MTGEELKATYDEWLGMTSEIEDRSDVEGEDWNLIYKSPTGVPMFSIVIFKIDGEWYFGGITWGKKFAYHAGEIGLKGETNVSN